MYKRKKEKVIVGVDTTLKATCEVCTALKVPDTIHLVARTTGKLIILLCSVIVNWFFRVRR